MIIKLNSDDELFPYTFSVHHILTIRVALSGQWAIIDS